MNTSGIRCGRFKVESAVAARRYQVEGGRCGVWRREERRVGVSIDEAGMVERFRLCYSVM